MPDSTTSGNFSDLLNSLSVCDYESYRPIILNPVKPADFQELNTLMSDRSPVLHRQLASQLKELIKIRTPRERLTKEELDQRYQSWKNEHDPDLYGRYVYYPWSNTLVHLLGPEEFVELRTSRNKYKISQQEQDLLAQKTIGIIGLSVGQSVALTLATERLCGHLRLADFDILELSNLNRIRSSVQNIGLEKTLMVAREIAEIDPYIRVDLFREGVNSANLEAFMEGDKKLDLLLEECDSLPVKIEARLLARQKGIPVIMDTSDRGMIDVERFDYNKNLPVLHGRAVESMDELASLSEAEYTQLLMKMVDFDNISERLKYSYGEIGKTLTTWPQLASDVISGGGFAAKISRLILLGYEVPSGRFYIELPPAMQLSVNITE